MRFQAHNAFVEEASHAYPHFDRFLSEMARVLRPGGHFLYVDFRGFLEYDAWEAALAGMLGQSRDTGE